MSEIRPVRGVCHGIFAARAEAFLQKQLSGKPKNLRILSPTMENLFAILFCRCLKWPEVAA
jgi:hypothetical protein